MIITFILGLIAGFVTPMLEPVVRQALENVTLAKSQVSESEFDLLTLILLLLVAALITGGDHAFALLLGALVGVFAKRLIAIAQGKGGAG